MRNRFFLCRPSVLGLSVIFLALSACSKGRDPLDTLPSEDKARAILEKALTAWKNGQPYGKVQGESPPIDVVDNRWQSGGKLLSYEIEQAVDKPGPRWFAVKLSLQDSPQPQRVHYAVMGLDPLLVMPEEDYDKACGMGKAE
jgi:hypothetical protein